MAVPITNYTFVVDLSSWNPDIDYAVLKSNGVEAIIAKLIQGNYYTDQQFDEHYAGAKKNGQLIAPYIWDDPGVAPQKEVDYFAKAVSPYQIDFIALDVEQHWKEWAEWKAGKMIQHYTSREIMEHATQVAELLSKRFGKLVVIYTGGWFIKYYSPVLGDWLQLRAKDFPAWIAAYIFSGGRTKMDWATIKAKLPKTAYAVPGGAPLKIWQIASNLIPPGAKWNIDINIFLGSYSELLKLVGSAVPTPEQPKYQVGIVQVPWRNYRTGPGTYYPAKGHAVYGTRVEIALRSGEWAKLTNGLWIWVERGVKL